VPESGNTVEPVAATARGIPRLQVLKALGDNTRHAIYLELARSAHPIGTAEIAERLGLHPNTVRPHLDRLRDVGLVDVWTEPRAGGVGRPQHRFSLRPGAPSLGLEPPAMPTLAALLVRLADAAGATGAEALYIGREQGEADAIGYTRAASCLEALVAELDDRGFEPTVGGTDDGETAVIAFAHCPYRELAEAHPELVCSLHRGMVEGFVDTMGDATVDAFHSLVHRAPCQVTISTR
jgi:predicted ArsR family transcriptional regulator